MNSDQHPERMTYEELSLQWNDPRQDYIVCHTSGSTGVPKEIQLPKARMTESALRTAAYFHLDGKSHLHSCISPEFIGGKMMLVRSETLGCSFSWEEPSNRPLDGYRGERIDLLSVVPSQLAYILENKDRMPEIRNILVGGAPLSESLKEKVVASRLNVYESYGMTETSSHIAVRRIVFPIPPFTTLPGITVEECDGRLLIHIQGWTDFLTNDAPEILSPTEFNILGRADNIIISGGIKLNPESIESRLEGKIGKAGEFYISSLPDEKWGEAVVLLTEAPEEKFPEIMSLCRECLGRYEIPKKIIHVDRVPHTPNGKIKRK